MEKKKRESSDEENVLENMFIIGAYRIKKRIVYLQRI